MKVKEVIYNFIPNRNQRSVLADFFTREYIACPCYGNNVCLNNDEGELPVEEICIKNAIDGQGNLVTDLVIYIKRTAQQD